MTVDLRRELDFDSVPPGKRHPVVSERFWAIIETAGIMRYIKGRCEPDFKDSIVIGLAPSYSVYDLQFSEYLIAVAARGFGSKVYLFDVLDAKNMNDMGEFLPGFGPVFHTPVAGIWKNGVLVQKSEGTRTREMIENAFQTENT